MVLVFLVILFSIVACGGDSGDEGGGRTSVVAAFYPLAFAAERIGGAAVDVTNATPPGAEPHDVELSPRDVDEIRDADVVLYLGGGFQPAFEDAVDGADGAAVDVLAELRLLERPEDADGQARDPHVWLDPRRYARIARRVGDALARPAAAERFASRLQALDAEFERGLAGCERRELVTSHAAFAYLADRYGLDEVALSGLAPEAEPTPQDLERTIDRVRETGATTVFVEPLVSPRLAETVAREAGVETATLDPVEGLTSDQLDKGEDYFSVMRDNLAALRKALECR